MADTEPAVIPMLTYEDCPAALDWLARAFGFKESLRLVDDNGRIGHAEMETGGGGLIMLASGPAGYESPAHRSERYPTIHEWWSAVPWVIDGVLVHTADVDQHHQRARQSGAHILSDPEDTPHGRQYRVEDLEGHRWMFMQPTTT
jgi:uncharacterized glyoxalase superfamily protein PhnB